MKKAETDVQTKVGSAAKVTTFLEIYSKPLMTAGTNTFINDMIGIAGGTNIGAAAGSGYPNFSTEILFKDDPAVYSADSGSMSNPGTSPSARATQTSPRSRTGTCTSFRTTSSRVPAPAWRRGSRSSPR